MSGRNISLGKKVGSVVAKWLPVWYSVKTDGVLVRKSEEEKNEEYIQRKRKGSSRKRITEEKAGKGGVVSNKKGERKEEGKVKEHEWKRQESWSTRVGGGGKNVKERA